MDIGPSYRFAMWFLVLLGILAVAGGIVIGILIGARPWA